MDLANIISGTLCKLLTSNGNDDINTWLLSFESLEIFINFMYEMTIKNASMSTNGIKEGSDIISQKKKKLNTYPVLTGSIRNPRRVSLTFIDLDF